MSKDLEEFLRQAAEMRQRKTAHLRAEAEQAESQARARSRPYTDARRERSIDVEEGYYDDVDDEILDERDVEILDAVHLPDDEEGSRGKPSTPSTISVKVAMPDAQIVDPHHVASPQTQPSPAHALRDLIRRPGGLRQAFLIREILNRPRY